MMRYSKLNSESKRKRTRVSPLEATRDYFSAPSYPSVGLEIDNAFKQLKTKIQTKKSLGRNLGYQADAHCLQCAVAWYAELN